MIVLKWLEPNSGAVCLITVEQSPLISHCSPICLLQTSKLHTQPSIISIFHISSAALSRKPARANALHANLPPMQTGVESAVEGRAVVSVFYLRRKRPNRFSFKGAPAKPSLL